MGAPPEDCDSNGFGHTSISAQNSALTAAAPRGSTWHFNKRLIVGNQSNYSTNRLRKQFGKEPRNTRKECKKPTPLRAPAFVYFVYFVVPFLSKVNLQSHDDRPFPR